MSHQEITSLHSHHVERVKALLGSRGKKIRKEDELFVADGIQSVRAALTSDRFPLISLYLTEKGEERLKADSPDIVLPPDTYRVSDAVMNEMSDTQTPQGILALLRIAPSKLDLAECKKIALFWQIQDPGNAGTVIRAADACGFDAVIFTSESVDVFSPKVVRSTAGSLWNIPIISDFILDQIFAPEFSLHSKLIFDGKGKSSLVGLNVPEKLIAVFGNEGRGLPEFEELVSAGGIGVNIPMQGGAESLNVASAASIAMFQLGAH